MEIAPDSTMDPWATLVQFSIDTTLKFVSTTVLDTYPYYVVHRSCCDMVTNSMSVPKRAELRQQLILMHDELRCPPIVYEHFREMRSGHAIIHRYLRIRRHYTGPTLSFSLRNIYRKSINLALAAKALVALSGASKMPHQATQHRRI